MRLVVTNAAKRTSTINKYFLKEKPERISVCNFYELTFQCYGEDRMQIERCKDDYSHSNNQEALGVLHCLMLYIYDDRLSEQQSVVLQVIYL